MKKNNYIKEIFDNICLKFKELYNKVLKKEKKRYKIISVFIPHKGCPEDCVFCNQVKIAGALPDITVDDAKKTIEENLETIKKEENDFIEIAFFGGSFTAVDEKYQNEMLELAKSYIDKGLVDGIRISTRPDKIDRNIINKLKKYGVTTIELGIQSSNDYILKKSRRGHTFDDVIKASKEIRKRGIAFGAQMMLGLPESTYIDETNTAKDIINLKPDMVRIYPTLVIKGTDLEKLYYSGEYEPLELAEAVEICKEISLLFEEKNIDVIRIGLQITEEISSPDKDGSSVIAGPFHNNFRELVDSAIWYDRILKQILKINSKVKEAKIYVHPKNASKILGYKKENIKKLKENYAIDVSLEYNMQMDLNDFKLEAVEVFEIDDLEIMGKK